MSVPPGRVSFGSHLFPFSGLSGGATETVDLPLLPLRIKRPGGSWSTPFNAILDTGSTMTILPAETASSLGLVHQSTRRAARGGGGPFDVHPCMTDMAIVDAHLPRVTCWEIADATIWVAADANSMDFPVVGWDLLGVFEVTLNHMNQSVLLKYPPR